MRKTTLSALFAIMLMMLLAPATWAQTGVSFGVKAGLNIADIKDLEEVDTVDEVTSEGKTGFIGGAYLKFPFGPFKLQAEGLYSIKGAETGFNLANKVSEIKLTYFEVPLMLKYEFPTPGIKPFVYGGGSVSFLMAAEVRDVVTNSEWVDIKDGMESLDYGLIVGGGVQIFNFSLDLRYNHGLANTVDDLGDDSLLAQAKNRTYSAMIGFKFF